MVGLRDWTQQTSTYSSFCDKFRMVSNKEEFISAPLNHPEKELKGTEYTVHSEMSISRHTHIVPVQIF